MKNLFNIKPKEKEITAEIRQFLRIMGVYHWKNWQGLGSTPGVADILGIYKGRLLAIEVKTDRGRLSEHQERFIERITDEGGIAFVARSVEDVEEALNDAKRQADPGAYPGPVWLKAGQR